MNKIQLPENVYKTIPVADFMQKYDCVWQWDDFIYTSVPDCIYLYSFNCIPENLQVERMMLNE